jgi:hypothetical protein
MRHQYHGWGVSLRYRGQTVGDRRIRGEAVIVGEDPACVFVVPGLGPAAVVARGDTLIGAQGLRGTVTLAGTRTPFVGPCPLRPGDHAELELGDDITLELRREDYPRLPFATWFNPRELARQLVIGAAAVATIAVLVRLESPVNTLELRGDPEADEGDSLLVRAMFAAAARVPPTRVHDLYTFEVPPPPPPAPPEPAPMPIAAVAEEVVPVPLAEVDAPVPAKLRKRNQPEVDRVQMIGVMNSDVFAELDGVPGGVLGGVLSDDLLAANSDLGEPHGVDTLVGIGTIAPIGDAPDPSSLQGPSGPVEAIMGPGSDHDVPPQEVVAAPLPRPGDVGTDSHIADGADAVHGVATGLAAVAPSDRCDDPSLVRKTQLDVVFVVDVSTTMTFMLDRIEKQIAQVDAEARSHALDPRYGLVVFVDDVQLANGGQPYTDLAALQQDLARWQAFTAGNRQINSTTLNLDWPENTLDAVHAAATQFAWRPADATLRVLVHATDDDFGEAPAVQSEQTVQHTYRETAAALRAAEVRMFSFAARIGGQCECLDVRAGLFKDFGGQPSLPDATGGAVFDIDAVAKGTLGFAAAVSGAIRSGVCTRYPLSPFPAKPAP